MEFQKQIEDAHKSDKITVNAGLYDKTIRKPDNPGYITIDIRGPRGGWYPGLTFNLATVDGMIKALQEAKFALIRCNSDADEVTK